MDFKSKVFRNFFIPGLVIELLLILCCILPESINPLYDIRFLKRPIGGPAGLTVGLVYLPYQLLTICFLLIACFNSIRLPILYKRGNDNFIKATRNFLIYGDFTLLTILIPALIQFSSLSFKDIESYINLPVVISVFSFGLLMCVFFIYWTVVTYREEKIKFFSKETIKSIGISIFLFICALLVLAACIVITYFIAESTPFIKRI